MRELRERAGLILRVLALILAALVVYQLAAICLHWNPFRGVTVPELPALAANPNAPSGGNATNLVATGNGTNGPRQLIGTNAAKSATAFNTNAPANTNVVARQETKLSGTNSAISTSAAAPTNALAAVPGAGTNCFAHAGPASTNENANTKLVTHPDIKLSGTNSALATNAAVHGTNVLSAATATGTNSAPGDRNAKLNAKRAPLPGMPGMNFNPFGPPGQGHIELPPAVKSRISKIVDSEILGPVMHPMPMALLGIAGDVAFLRSAQGQTGLVKAGDTLDDIKLLRIGVNRVLIEQAGDKKELLIFDGYGGASLLPNNSTNENNHP